ncbi:MAG: family 20 glycosylhydrolase [Tannerella sp.]|nr:family 20 glycosylhydrolase [Tannerella sp.]
MKTLIYNLLSLSFKRCFYAMLFLASILSLSAQTQEKKIDELLPVRGLSVSAPSPEGVDDFLRFIEEELAPAHFNLLILLVGWNYAYETHPELCAENPLTQADVKRIVAVCRKYGIEIAPSINLLGHQSAEKTTGNLLRVYPEFDETPHLKTEDFSGYDWFNPDFFYCKSYCPLHPGVHKVIFDVVDELTDMFETSLFHAGMDEVTIIGDAHCPRCGGRDRAELFAGEVATIHNHLAQQGKRMMIWGDRLIDGKSTGFHPSESSMNNTHRAIDLIPKDVFVCDWHYGQAHQSPVYFAMKGLDVAICPCANVNVAMQELEDMLRFRERATTVLKPHFRGVITTIWSGNKAFLQGYYATGEASPESVVVKQLMGTYKKLNQQ